MSEAREVARLEALRSIKTAGEKDWHARAEWLRLTFPADYRTGGKVEVNAHASVTHNHISLERQKALQDRQQASLAKR